MKLTKLAKSKTLILAFLTAVLPQVIELLPNLKMVLADHYLTVFFGLSLLMGIVRYFTTTSLSEK